MSDLLAVGASALRSSRAALAVVGDNVANAQTDGYVRRDLRIDEVRLGGGSPLYRNRLSQDGAEPGAIVRLTDQFRNSEARATAGDDARAQAMASWLGIGETALNTGIAPALTAIFANADRLAALPNDATARASLAASIIAARETIAGARAALERTADGIAAARTATLDAANTDLGALATLNLTIARQVAGTTSFVELEDQRDMLLDRIATTIGAQAQVLPDGTARVTLTNAVLVDRGQAATIPASDRGALGGLALATTAMAVQIADLDALDSRLTTLVNDWGSGDPLVLADRRSASGLEAEAARLIGRAATATAAAKTAAEQTGARRDIAAAARDALEGVDLDREAANLLRHQQSYQGAAKIVQAAKDGFDAILALFR